MSFRTPVDVKEEFRASPRRALILTTVIHESRAVKAHLVETEVIIGEKGAFYEYGRFPDPAGDWRVVHAITSQGNSDAGLVAGKAFQEFGSFQVLMFVGIAGSLKEDIPIGSVVVGDYVYNGHSAKVGDTETLGRPHGLATQRELLTAAQGLIYSDGWRDLIRAPHGLELPSKADYPCEFPPVAIIKGIVSGEEVVAGDKSQRYSWLRLHFNDCGAVEMEGWGVMNAAHHENAAAIIVRGVSDMCVGKDHAADKLHQPIAAAHAAAFAFSILSFRSKVPSPTGVSVGEAQQAVDTSAVTSTQRERRIEVVFNFEGSKDEWSKEKLDAVVNCLRRAIDDEELSLVRVEAGSVRLVTSVRQRDAEAFDLLTLREATSHAGVTLLGVAPLEQMGEAERAKKALAAASVGLLKWERTLPNGEWLERPEGHAIEVRFELPSSSTALLGDPGSGKSALLSKIASELVGKGAALFALKADFLSTEVRTEADLQEELQLPSLPSDLILQLAALQPVYVLIDQLDALASQLDLRSGRLNVLLNLIRRIGGKPNVHVLLSARNFEFNHDVRLRAIDAESVILALPPWHEVKDRLADVGIDPDAWPENARAVVRSPQALKTFIALVRSGRTEPFGTYQAMLEQLWRDRIASADDSERLIALASDLAEQMAEEEALWLAASRFDDRLSSLKRLEALGFIVRSENDLSIAFSHQTIFDYVLARTFVRSAGLLSSYVLERQDSLFVRAKLWSALNYLRDAEERSYERELSAVWKEGDLRRHLRILLVEFLGQVAQPLELEKQYMGEALSLPDLRLLALKALGSSPGWFAHFSSTAIPDAMTGPDAEANQACRILGLNWRADAERVVRLIEERWLPSPEKDGYSWTAVSECHAWTGEVEAIAAGILKRTPVSIWHVGHTAMSLAVDQPDAAMRLVRAKLDFLLTEARRSPEPPQYPVNGNEVEQVTWHIDHNPIKRFEELLEAAEWSDLPSLSEAAPDAFLHYFWPWYVAVFDEILARREQQTVAHLYSGRYVLELERSRARSASQERPVVSALQIAVEELAERAPAQFKEWADRNSSTEIMIVQQLIARGYEVAADELAPCALDWVIADERRFQLGSRYGLRSDSIDLIGACVPHWSEAEVCRFEKAVLSYRPEVPGHFKEPEERRLFADLVRATKKDLLKATGVERLTPAARELVATEQRALGDRFDRVMSEVEGGFIGSPMDAEAMAKAKDRDILKIFREIPDSTNWDHPTHWLRGGNIQLSRAFAETAKADPARSVRLMGQFEPLQQERAAGYALDAMADEASNDQRVVDVLLDLDARGFKGDEFRSSASHAVEKIARRKTEIREEVINVLVAWLEAGSDSQDELTDGEESESDSSSKDESLRQESILWGHGVSSLLPGGSFSMLSALATILLSKGEADRDRYFAILYGHLERERNPSVWKALLYRVSNAGGSTPQVVSGFLRKLFERFPGILNSREAVRFLAYAQRWDDRLVFDLISGWRHSGSAFLQRAYGELVGLVAHAKSVESWMGAQADVIASGTDDMKIGLAHAAANLWPDGNIRHKCSLTLVALLKVGNKEVVSAVMDVFRVVDEFVPDAPTVELLRALTDPAVDMSSAPSHYVVESLQMLLPHQAELVAAIALKLAWAWRYDLGDMRTGTAMAAPQLTDLALTLHRLGGASRESGVTLFEAMIEIDAYGSRETLAEIDGRFGHVALARQRLARRRRSRRSRRGGA